MQHTIGMMIRTGWLAVALVGCPVADDDDGPGDDDGGDDDSAPAGPCEDGGWGLIGGPDGWLHVDGVGGSDDGDGSAEAPLQTLAAALERSREDGQPRRIAVWPPHWDEHGPYTLTGADSGLEIVGCEAGQYELHAASGEPVFRIGEATGVRLAGLQLWGGTDALWISAGAEVLVEDARLYVPQCRGVVVSGSETQATLRGVHLTSVMGCEDDVAAAVYVDGATAELDGLSVHDAIGVGVVGIGADLTIRDSLISAMSPSEDGWGRCVHLEQASTAVIEGTVFGGCWETSLFAMDSALPAVVGNTFEGVDTHPGGAGGDAVVLTQTQGADPAEFTAVLDGNEILYSDRAGIVVDATSAELSGTTTEDPIYGQNGAITSGTDPATAPPAPLELDRTPFPW